MYKEILTEFKALLIKVYNYDALLKLKVKYIGKHGIINRELQYTKCLNIKNDEKNLIFKNLNEIKKTIENEILKKKLHVIKVNTSQDTIDITLPGFGINIGSEHIISKSITEIKTFFTHFGFKIQNGYEIDTTYYNFDALNINDEHPSRSRNDSFYISKNTVLRTHTSNMQIHIMEENKPPLKCLSYGKVYRKDSDASHTPMFHQVEGFVIDKNISIANLKFLLINFLKYFFENEDIKINIRSSYFPFTEPSIEIDIECISCFGKKCALCKYSGWIEVLGCGLIHPNVLKRCKIDKQFNGLAFGMGIERLSMIKYQIHDIRLYFENNIDFLKQF